MAGALVGSQLVFNSDGSLALATPFTVWDDQAAGVELTGCTMPDGLTPAILETSADGLSPAIRLPEGEPVGYIDIGASARQQLIPGQSIKDAALAPAIATAAQSAAEAAQAAAETAQAAAEQAASQVNTAASIDGGTF